MTSCSFSELLDLSLGTPEIGAVNFNVLHKLLGLVLAHLGIANNRSTDIGDDERKLLAGAQSPTKGPKEKEGASVSERGGGPREPSPRGGSAGQKRALMGDGKPAPRDKSASDDVSPALTEMVDRLSKRLDRLTSLPTSTDTFDKSARDKESPDTPMAETWRFMALKNRIDANENAIEKLASLLEGNIKDLNNLKEDTTKDFETISNAVSTQGNRLDEMAPLLDRLRRSVSDIIGRPSLEGVHEDSQGDVDEDVSDEQKQTDSEPTKTDKKGDSRKEARSESSTEKDKGKKDEKSKDDKDKREDKVGKDDKAKREDKVGKDDKAKREDKVGKDDKAKREDKVGKDDKAKREDKVGKDDKAKREDKVGKDDKAKREDKVGKDDKAKREDKVGKDDKAKREDEVGKDDKAKREDKMGNDDKAERGDKVGKDDKDKRDRKGSKKSVGHISSGSSPIQNFPDTERKMDQIEDDIDELRQKIDNIQGKLGGTALKHFKDMVKDVQNLKSVVDILEHAVPLKDRKDAAEKTKKDHDSLSSSEELSVGDEGTGEKGKHGQDKQPGEESGEMSHSSDNQDGIGKPDLEEVDGSKRSGSVKPSLPGDSEKKRERENGHYSSSDLEKSDDSASGTGKDGKVSDRTRRKSSDKDKDSTRLDGELSGDTKRIGDDEGARVPARHKRKRISSSKKPSAANYNELIDWLNALEDRVDALSRYCVPGSERAVHARDGRKLSEKDSRSTPDTDVDIENTKEILDDIVDQINGILQEEEEESQDITPANLLSKLSKGTLDIFEETTDLSPAALNYRLLRLAASLAKKLRALKHRVTILETMTKQMARSLKLTFKRSNMAPADLDSETVNHLKQIVKKMQRDFEEVLDKLTGSGEDYNRQAKLMEDLTAYCYNMSDRKADKAFVTASLEPKANREELDSKLFSNLFNITVEELNKMIKDVIDRVGENEENSMLNSKKLYSELDSKCDRLELATIRNWLETQIKNIREKINKRLDEFTGDAAAGLKRQLLHFHCLSCDKPLEVIPQPPIPSIPMAGSLPARKNVKFYTAFELDQIRENARKRFQGDPVENYKSALAERRLAKMRKDNNLGALFTMLNAAPEVPSIKPRETLGGSVPIVDIHSSTNRSCGGMHTLTYPTGRVTRLSQISQLLQDEADEFYHHITYDDAALLGMDGKYYRGGLSDNRVNTQKPAKISPRGPKLQSQVLETHFLFPQLDQPPASPNEQTSKV